MRNTQSSSTPPEQESLKTDKPETPQEGKSKGKSKAKQLATASLSYESALEELKTLVQKLESGQLPLDDLFFVYQRGAELLQICKQKLQVVEDQVQVLQKQGEAQAWKSEA